MNKYILILISFIISTNCFAAWEGFPCPSNTTFYSVQTNKYVSQLFTGLIERCMAVNVSSPIIVDTLTGYAGYRNEVEDVGYFTNGWIWICDPPAIEPYLDDDYTIPNPAWEEWMWDCWAWYDQYDPLWVHTKYTTNKILIYTNIVVTNQFEAFTYSYSSPEISGTETINPPIRASWFLAFDNKLRDVVVHSSAGYWVDTNKFFNGDPIYGETFLRTLPNAYYTATNNSWLIKGMGKLCYIGGFGTWGNTNSTYSIDSSYVPGYFTHRVSVKTNEWVLGTIIYTRVPVMDYYYNILYYTNTWKFKNTGPLTLNLIDRSIRPVLEYKPAGTNPFTSSLSFSISGGSLTWQNSGLANGGGFTQNFTVDDPLYRYFTNPVYSVDSISVEGMPPNLNDAWRVVYKCDFTIFANNDVYRLYPIDINERQKALNLLTHVYRRNPERYGEIWEGSGYDPNFNTARQEALDDWQGGDGSEYGYDGFDSGAGVYYTDQYNPDFEITGFLYKGTNWNYHQNPIHMPARFYNVTYPTNKNIKITQYLQLIGAYWGNVGGWDRAYVTDNPNIVFYNYGLTTASGSDFSYDKMLPVCQWTSIGGNPVGQGLPDFGEVNKTKIIDSYINRKYVGCWPNERMIIADHTTWYTKK
jgi:hypothetical protein